MIEGRYRLERLLGTGGMAEVWLAEDQRLRRWVALKALRESFTAEADAEAIAGFEREAQVIARLQHQNIVGVYDAGTFDGRKYLVMEYVHGYSLRQLLESQGRVTEAEAIRYGTQIAAALQYAHSQGVIHCDIKPENVIISESGVAKVADFGVAESLTKTMAPGRAQDLLGTIAYLAPEIIEGADPSPASDIYSLGLTMFELVAGRTPFSGASAGAALGQRLATPAPPLRTFARGATPELEQVLARSLAVSPLDRFASAAAFATALQRVPPVTGVPVAPVAAPPGRPPQLSQRQDTARVRRSAAQQGGISGATVVLIVGIILAALGVGIGAALLLGGLDDDDDGGGEATATPTKATTEATPPSATTTRAATQPPATQAPTAEPSPTATQAASATATQPPPTQAATATPTRTPTPGVSPTVAAATATP